WANVVRWEMRTRLFLRTMEFYWQEGHTAHATHDEGYAETIQMLNIYSDFAINEAAIPVLKGRKSQSEKFAGALNSYSIEAMMGDTKALQAATSHDLGQNFAKAFEIQYLNQNNVLEYCWTTSWGLSTRFIGAIIMTHGDDQGLVLPPRLAPIQIVLVPIYRNPDEKAIVMPVVEQLASQLKNFRIKVDAREEMTPGYKFNDWEMRGVPLRLEIGPKDVQNGVATASRRDQPGKQGKSAIPFSQVSEKAGLLLDDIQNALLEKAVRFRDAHIYEPTDYNELVDIVQNGWAYSWWCGDPACEAKIKEDMKATTRNIPMDQSGSGFCIVCGKPAKEKVYISKAY
ncbi:MAG: proline--tRNA ligase, partial [Chloroflexi bacterium]|nr:proline--tRNA ligase [Chloroflexota bacterium]